MVPPVFLSFSLSYEAFFVVDVIVSSLHLNFIRCHFFCGRRFGHVGVRVMSHLSRIFVLACSGGDGDGGVGGGKWRTTGSFSYS